MKLNIVPARTGLVWVKLGVTTFFRQPLALAGLFFMYMTAASVLSVIPVLGLVLALAIVPACTLGLMAATQEAARGKFPMPSILISAFRAGRQRLRAMLMLGFLYAAACLLVSMLANLIAPLPAAPEGGQEAMLTPEFQQAMIITMIMYLPVSLLFWHAPALVHWHDVPPVKSLFFSLVACLRNTGAYLVFGLGWAGVFLLSGLLMTLVIGMLGGAQNAPAVILPAAMLMASMFFCSLYFTFRDCFVAEPDASTESGDSP